MAEVADIDEFMSRVKARLRESESGVNLLYIHGFASSGASGTAQHLADYLPGCRVVAPDLPLPAREALEMLRQLVRDEKINVVVGTSMGGMFAQKLRGVPKVLVNPSFHVSESMRRKIGTVPYFKPRRDGATEFEVTAELCDGYRELESGQFEEITDAERALTWGLFGSDDDVVSCEAEYDRYYTNKKIFPGGHRLTSEAIRSYVIDTVLQLLGL